MKQTILLICLTISCSFFAQTEGVYFTQADCESNKIDTSLHCGGWNDTHVSFKQGDSVVGYAMIDIYGYINHKGQFFRCGEKQGLLQQYVSGRICIYAAMNFDFKKDALALIQSSYICEGRTGELKRVSKKQLEGILKNDQDLLDKYLIDKDVIYAITMYNSRHK